MAAVEEGHYNPALHLNHGQIYTCCAQLIVCPLAKLVVAAYYYSKIFASYTSVRVLSLCFFFMPGSQCIAGTAILFTAFCLPGAVAACLFGIFLL